MQLSKHASFSSISIKAQASFDKEAGYVRRYPCGITPPRSLARRNKILSRNTRSYLQLREECKSISIINVTQDSEQIYWNDETICDAAMINVITGEMP